MQYSWLGDTEIWEAPNREQQAAIKTAVKDAAKLQRKHGVRIGQVWLHPELGTLTINATDAHYEKGKTLLKNIHGKTVEMTAGVLCRSCLLRHDPSLPFRSVLEQ